MNWATIATLVFPVVLGICWGVAYPKWGVAGLAWVVPGGLMWLAIAGKKGAFRVGYLAGFVAYLVSLSWLLNIPFPAGAVAGWVALSAYLALYPAVWAWFCQFTLRRWTGGESGMGEGWRSGNGGGNPSAWNALLGGSWVRRSLWGLVMAASWVAWEMAVSRMLSGFPWLHLGMSQYAMVPLIQVGSLTGIYGISFLVVWFSVSLALAFGQLLQRPERRWNWLPELGLPLLALLVVVIAGFDRMRETQPVERMLSMALVQPSIPQELIWDASEDDNRFERLMELSRLAVATRPEVLVWPEAALPAFTQANYEAITNLIVESGVWMVFGADDSEPRRTASGEEGYDVFNAAFLFSPDGRYQASYRKQRLVIFGEYVPFAEWLPFMKMLTPIQGSFREGPGPVDFAIGEPAVEAGILICFEDVFPHGARTHVTDRTDFLLNLTNNGWFGESAAQWQHAANAVFRAVENGLPLVRCTNNGLTCWIDANGRMREVFRAAEGDEYDRGYMVVQIPLVGGGGDKRGTFYRRNGDVFGWMAVGLAVVAGFWKRRKPGVGG